MAICHLTPHKRRWLTDVRTLLYFCHDRLPSSRICAGSVRYGVPAVVGVSICCAACLNRRICILSNNKLLYAPDVFVSQAQNAPIVYGAGAPKPPSRVLREYAHHSPSAPRLIAPPLPFI